MDAIQQGMPAPNRAVAIIGAGPAGLMAAEVLCRAGVAVTIYDAMPSPGRKFLRAGIGGLNLTHSEDYATFCQRYGERRPQLQRILDAFPPQALRAWVHGLGIETYVGSSGRVFPREMKAAPLLRAWLHRLRTAGVRFQMRHRWLGWNADGSLRLVTPPGRSGDHARGDRAGAGRSQLAAIGLGWRLGCLLACARHRHC